MLIMDEDSRNHLYSRACLHGGSNADVLKEKAQALTLSIC